jgi:hypothetical protein
MHLPLLGGFFSDILPEERMQNKINPTSTPNRHTIFPSLLPCPFRTASDYPAACENPRS